MNSGFVTHSSLSIMALMLFPDLDENTVTWLNHSRRTWFLFLENNIPIDLQNQFASHMNLDPNAQLMLIFWSGPSSILTTQYVINIKPNLWHPFQCNLFFVLTFPLVSAICSCKERGLVPILGWVTNYYYKATPRPILPHFPEQAGCSGCLYSSPTPVAWVLASSLGQQAS